jgi:hypothetical protein
LGDDEALLSEHAHSTLDGHRCDAVLLGQVAVRGEALAGRQLAARDGRAQVVGHLLERLSGVVLPDRHAPDGTRLRPF